MSRTDWFAAAAAAGKGCAAAAGVGCAAAAGKGCAAAACKAQKLLQVCIGISQCSLIILQSFEFFWFCAPVDVLRWCEYRLASKRIGW